MRYSRTLLTIIGLLACLLLSGPTLAQQTAPSAESALSTGIHVLGEWKIVVLDPDGTVIETREFRNALTAPSLLASALAGDALLGGTYVVLEPANGQTGPCQGSECTIVPSDLTISVSPDSTNLVETIEGTNFETLKLEGSVTVDTPASITQVATWTLACGPAKTMAQCKSGADSENRFTTKTLASAVAVTAGQIVQVTVRLTFS